jgi:hypothetical protein
MISLALAQQLRNAGLTWQPAERDLFALPDREMDEQIFVISVLPAMLQLHGGQPAVAFLASAEWALDYVLLGEVVWLPTEAQLRKALEAQIAPEAGLTLSRRMDGYCCTVEIAGSDREFDGPDAESAYALALLAVLEQ